MGRSDFSIDIRSLSFPPRTLPNGSDRWRSLGVRLSNVPPLPPRILPDHGRIPGVMSDGTLTQIRDPAQRFTFVRCCGSLTASIPHGLTACRYRGHPLMQLLSLAVASDRPRKGLTPSITQPCPTHLHSASGLTPAAAHGIPCSTLITTGTGYGGSAPRFTHLAHHTLHCGGDLLPRPTDYRRFLYN